jgi:branched-chain amino acid transport system permease protein
MTTRTLRPATAHRRWLPWAALTVGLVLPVADLLLPPSARLTGHFVPVLAYAIIALGLNIVVGFTGFLHLGAAAFMAVGAYAFAILCAPSFPFQWGFWPSLGAAALVGAAAGWALALPTIRLRGDYLTIVTLGSCEIVRELLKNLAPITKGPQGINPLPAPWGFTALEPRPWYFLFLAIAVAATLLCVHLRRSAVGRAWTAVREDELAARSSGVAVDRAKRSAFVWGAALCALGGALLAAYATGVEPSIYDFQMSVLVLCIVVIGGMGSVAGVILGAVLLMGFNQVGVPLITRLLGGGAEAHPLLDANNWKFLVFGLALILTMRLRPEGLLPAREVRDELHHDDDPEIERGGELR